MQERIYNFSENEKVLLNPKFEKNLMFNKIKHKKIYKKIDAIVIKKSGFKKYNKDAWIKLLDENEINNILDNVLIDNNDV